MTLEELLGQRKLVGRTIESQSADNFIFRGRIREAQKWDRGLVRFALADVCRRYKHPEATWRHLPDSALLAGAGTPVEFGIDGSIMFPLPEGGRATILPEEKRGSGGKR